MDTVTKVMVVWLQEGSVYTHDAKKVEYEKLSIQQFVQGFLTVIRREEAAARLLHLETMMRDAVSYPWVGVKVAHAVLIQHMEQQQADWTDDFLPLPREL